MAKHEWLHDPMREVYVCSACNKSVHKAATVVAPWLMDSECKQRRYTEAQLAEATELLNRARMIDVAAREASELDGYKVHVEAVRRSAPGIIVRSDERVSPYRLNPSGETELKPAKEKSLFKSWRVK